MQFPDWKYELLTKLMPYRRKVTNRPSGLNTFGHSPVLDLNPELKQADLLPHAGLNEIYERADNALLYESIVVDAHDIPRQDMPVTSPEFHVGPIQPMTSPVLSALEQQVLSDVEPELNPRNQLFLYDDGYFRQLPNAESLEGIIEGAPPIADDATLIQEPMMQPDEMLLNDPLFGPGL